MSKKVVAEATELSNVGNGAEKALALEQPYAIIAKVVGTSPILFHRWDCEAIEEKAKAKKGSEAKKTDDINTFVYKNEAGELCIPAEYFRQSVIHAAKYRQDPRSPRKSAMDIFKAGLATLDSYCSLGVDKWDYVDRRRVMIQRNGVTRSRPAMHEGWTCEVRLQVLLPEYIQPWFLNEVLQYAGRIVGVGDFRPSFGRFQVVKFEMLSEEESS